MDAAGQERRLSKGGHSGMQQNRAREGKIILPNDQIVTAFCSYNTVCDDFGNGVMDSLPSLTLFGGSAMPVKHGT